MKLELVSPVPLLCRSGVNNPPTPLVGFSRQRAFIIITLTSTGIRAAPSRP
jgi:hypothetical protein